MNGKITDRKVSLEHQGQKVRFACDERHHVLTLIYVPGEGARLVNREAKIQEPDIELDQETWAAITPLKGVQADGCSLALIL